MARKMSATERAARDVVNKYVRDGLMERSQANAAIRDGLHIAETTVRQHYREGFGSALYYGGKVAAAREEFNAAKGMVARRVKGSRLLATEIYAAVFAVVETEESPRDGDQLTPDQAEHVMATVRETAREVREEASAPCSAPSVAA